MKIDPHNSISLLFKVQKRLISYKRFFILIDFACLLWKIYLRLFSNRLYNIRRNNSCDFTLCLCFRMILCWVNRLARRINSSYFYNWPLRLMLIFYFYIRRLTTFWRIWWTWSFFFPGNFQNCYTLLRLNILFLKRDGIFSNNF